MTMGRFKPNFEHLIYTLELLEEYTDTVRLPQQGAFNIISELCEILGFHNMTEAYAALSYALMRISADSQLVNPLLQIVQIKGASAKYMWAAKTLRKIVADNFPKEHDLRYLTPFKDLILEDSRDLVIATTNYDLVLDQFFDNHNITYDDGFSICDELSPWIGFRKCDTRVTYLKLHGSLTWFLIKKSWFASEPLELAANETYKYPRGDITQLLKDELSKKELDNQKYKYEFNNPHLIMGGAKDKKILDSPFVEISREWVNSLALADTVVIVGASASDFHLLQQIRGILVNNKQLDKIICINPDRSANNAYGEFFKAITNTGGPPYMFFIDYHWDFKKIQKEYKLSLKDILLMPSTELYAHYKDSLQA